MTNSLVLLLLTVPTGTTGGQEVRVGVIVWSFFPVFLGGEYPTEALDRHRLA